MGAHLRWVLKARALDTGANPLFYRRTMGSGVPLLIVWWCAGNGVYGETMSHTVLPVSMGLLFAAGIRAHSFLDFFEKNVCV